MFLIQYNNINSSDAISTILKCTQILRLHKDKNHTQHFTRYIIYFICSSPVQYLTLLFYKNFISMSALQNPRKDNFLRF